jgi:hypothetical protein
MENVMIHCDLTRVPHERQTAKEVSHSSLAQGDAFGE